MSDYSKLGARHDDVGIAADIAAGRVENVEVACDFPEPVTPIRVHGNAARRGVGDRVQIKWSPNNVASGGSATHCILISHQKA